MYRCRVCAVLLVAVIATMALASAAGAKSLGRGRTYLPHALETREAIAYGTHGKALVIGNGITRLKANGSIDRSFGTAGHVDILVDAASVLANGKILVLGTPVVGPNSEPTVTRLLPNGRIDQSFVENGVVSVEIGSEEDIASAMTTRTDGRILVAGVGGRTITRIGFTGQIDAIVQLLPNGEVDRSFGSEGRLWWNGYGTGDPPLAVGWGSLVPGPGGKLLAASEDGETLVRILPNGSFDSAFGTNGAVKTRSIVASLGYPRWSRPIVRSDESIVLFGTTTTRVGDEPHNGTVAVGLEPNGALRQLYGRGGVSEISFPGATDSYFGQGVGRKNGGALIAAETASPAGGRLAAAALGERGGLNPRFGRGGTMQIRFPCWSAGRDVVLQPRGRALVLGSCMPGSADGMKGTVVARVPLKRHGKANGNGR